jgi:DNA polymerase III epsilon subunit-like protein
MAFDLGCLTACLREFCGQEESFKTYCTMKIWQGAFDGKGLDDCCEGNDIELFRHHNAVADAEACAQLFIIAVEKGMDLKD